MPTTIDLTNYNALVNDDGSNTVGTIATKAALLLNPILTPVQTAITALDAVDALKAPLASPTFTGVPAAPTAAGGTNTTQLATTAFVISTVAAGGATFFNVKSYGAIGDGVADDTTAIAATFTAAAGKVVYFPPGTYIDTGTHSLTAGQQIRGDGIGVSIIFSKHATIAWAIIDVVGCVIQDLTIQGNKATNGFQAVQIKDTTTPARFAVLRNLLIQNFTSHGVRVTGAWKCTFDNVRSITNTGSGFYIEKGTSEPAHHEFRGCQSESNGGNGWTVTTATAVPSIVGIVWINCVSISNTGNGYDLTNVTDLSFLGSYSASETGALGINATTCIGLSVVGGGFHNLTTGISLTTSVADVQGTYFNNNTKHIWVKTGSRGGSRSCNFNTGTAITTDAGGVHWNDDPATHLYATATPYTDTGVCVGPFSAKVWNGAAQTIVQNVATALLFDTESYDIGGVHSTSSNTSRFTIPVGGRGRWQFSAGLVYAANATGTFRDLYIYKNGARIALGGRVTPTAVLVVLNCSTGPIDCIDGDYFEAYTQHDASAGVATTAGVDTTWFAGGRVGS